MLNKTIRNWTECLKADTLSPLAEVFLARLFMCVDNNGCFYAHPKLLRAALFPLRIDAITDNDINTWLTECAHAGIIELYTTDQMPYLHISGYSRKRSRKKTTYPTPPGFEEENNTVPSTTTLNTVQGKEETKKDTVKTKPVSAIPDDPTITLKNDKAIQYLAMLRGLRGKKLENVIREFFRKEAAAGHVYSTIEDMKSDLKEHIYV